MNLWVSVEKGTKSKGEQKSERAREQESDRESRIKFKRFCHILEKLAFRGVG